MSSPRVQTALSLSLALALTHCGAPTEPLDGSVVPDSALASPDGTPPPDAATTADAEALDAITDDALEPAMDAVAPPDATAPMQDAARDATSDTQTDAGPSGPMVDRRMPQLFSLSFRPSEADPMARVADGTQLVHLDTRVAPLGRLVVYLHGAGRPSTCGSNEHGRVLASYGFHVIAPCYISDYGVGVCGNDIAGCRLEAFDGTDRHPAITIARADSIEERVVRALQLLVRRNPQGDWGYFLDAGRPRWGSIVISGISHGASSSGVISQVRGVERAVMLSGPLDTNQAWLMRAGMTPVARLWSFSHTADSQHMGHLASIATLGLAGPPTNVETTAAPYANSHRLISSLMTTDGHGSTQAGGVSPRDAMGNYRFDRAWRTMYGAR
ncbi:MAG: hypothetical protein Q8Q09_24700 [Deltaproteobacteria bacterium]|nr:hypothetical protein [Deltaproteobacteria bacterium]